MYNPRTGYDRASTEQTGQHRAFLKKPSVSAHLKKTDHYRAIMVGQYRAILKQPKITVPHKTGQRSTVDRNSVQQHPKTVPHLPYFQTVPCNTFGYQQCAHSLMHMHELICNVKIHRFSLLLIDIGTEHLWI